MVNTLFVNESKFSSRGTDNSTEEKIRKYAEKDSVAKVRLKVAISASSAIENSSLPSFTSRVLLTAKTESANEQTSNKSITAKPITDDRSRRICQTYIPIQ